MKKLYIVICILLCFHFSSKAQSIIYSNGPLVNSPGLGSGGADVSNTHDGLVNFGYNQNHALGFFIADDFTVPAGETWMIDSVILYGYQTNSTLTSTFTDLYVCILDKSPDDPTAVVLFGDSTANVLSESSWSGIYRTSETTFTNTARPIMRNSGELSGTLNAGTYWLVWSQAGSLASGPWNPPISINVVLITGNALQYVAASTTWQPVIDTAQAGPADDSQQGFPFSFHGTIVTGISDVQHDNSLSVFPNPVTSKAQVTLPSNIDLSRQTASFVINDMLGKVVKQIDRISAKSFTFGKENLTPGIYFYKVLKGSSVISQGKMSIE